MSSRPRARFTIGQLMVLIAGLALAWGLGTSPGAARFIASTLLPVTILIVGPLAIARHLVDNALGTACPGCGQATMERRALASFGPRYYRCSSCGVRCRRSPFGPWQDASDPEYDAKFRRKPDEDPWTAPPGLEDDDLISSKTHVNLVASKRRRHPDDPNGPGLE